MPKRGRGYRVAGHSLVCREGTENRPARFTDDAEPLVEGTDGRVMCACGLMSPPGLSVHSAREWHIDHKFAVLDGGRDE